MTPKEKADSIFHQMYKILWHTNADPIHCKECALIAVEEVRFFHESLFYATEGSLFDDYLNKVKQEIEKL